MTDTPSTQEPTQPLNLDALTSQERIDYLIDIRKRVAADPKSVSNDEIRDAVRLIRLDRAEPTRRSTKTSKTPKTVSLSDF